MWIEIRYLSCQEIPSGSHSLRGSVDWNNSRPCARDDKHSHSLRGSVDWNTYCIVHFWFPVVTPCVGVWIEIVRTSSSVAIFSSLPAWECGLKYKVSLRPVTQSRVTPCVGVWIEMVRTSSSVATFSVTPCVGVWIEIKQGDIYRMIDLVTPCVGVWIEMTYNKSTIFCTLGHSLRGSVDWNRFKIIDFDSQIGHSLRGSVDWNIHVGLSLASICDVTPCVGVWIEIRTI